MVSAADSLKTRLAALSGEGVQVHLTGASGMWCDFNAANRTAMLKSEVISWPVTLGILLLAFGSLVAAGLPLMLTMIGLASAAGLLYLGTLVMPISIWAMNFALMFALALGIDYALFVVHRFRGAFFGHKLSAVEATAVTMDTAGKAVLFSGVTVLISLTAVMLVPSPAFRSMSLGIMLAVIFVLAATLTLLPAVLSRLGPKVDKLALPWAHSGEHRSPRFARWGERLWRQPLRYGLVALVILIGLALPDHAAETGDALDQGRSGLGRLARGLQPGPGGVRSGRARSAADRRTRSADQRRRANCYPRPRGGGVDAHSNRWWLRADPGDPEAGPVRPGRRPHDRPAPGRFARRLAYRRRGRREPRPAGRVVSQDAARDRRDPRPRLPAVADRAPGTVAGRNRRADEPAGHRRRFRCCQVGLPGRRAALAARLSVPGLPRRLGTGVLLRDDLRDLDGLHRVPAVGGQGALGPHPRPPRGDGRQQSRTPAG